MAEEIAADLGAGIRADRARDIVLLTLGDIRIHSVNRRRRRKDELLDLVLLGEFEQILSGDHICSLVADGIFDRRTNARFSG